MKNYKSCKNNIFNLKVPEHSIYRYIYVYLYIQVETSSLDIFKYLVLSEKTPLNCLWLYKYFLRKQVCSWKLVKIGFGVLGHWTSLFEIPGRFFKEKIKYCFPNIQTLKGPSGINKHRKCEGFARKIICFSEENTLRDFRLFCYQKSFKDVLCFQNCCTL